MPEMMNEVAQGQIDADMGAGMAPEGMEGGAESNPLTDAIRTLGIFVTAQAEKGNPQAAQMKMAFEAFMKSLLPGMQGEEASPVAGPAPQEPSQGGNQIPENFGNNAIAL